MSKNFLEGLEKLSNLTNTENGAVALKSTNSYVMDLFSSIGGMRTEEEDRIVNKFSKAMAEDKLLTMKTLFYVRDIRNGLGERRIARVIYNFLADNYIDILVKNIHNIVDFGRWDDLTFLLNKDNKILNKVIIGKISEQLLEDSESEYPSLCAKWLASPNTSSLKTRNLAKKIYSGLMMTERSYRKLLSMLRKKIDIVERKISNNEWNSINYSKVPSRAMMIYRNAFRKHNEEGFQEYLDSLQKGEAKINSGTLYPYDIIEKIMCTTYDGFSVRQDVVLEEQWKTLPNYIDSENNVLIMADTSGSMIGRPMNTSVGLAIYFAERNKGYYHNKFMTFSSEPSFIEIKGDTLAEKIRCVPSIVSDTNLEKAFMLILDTAVKNNVSQGDLPKSLVVISDMQFNAAQGYRRDRTNTWYEEMKERFHSKGYEIPNIVFWDVDNRRDSYQATCAYEGVQLVSGQSTGIFKTLLQNLGKTPYQAMLDVLNQERYNIVSV